MLTERKKRLVELYNDLSLSVEEAAEKAGCGRRYLHKVISELRAEGKVTLVDRKSGIKSVEDLPKPVEQKPAELKPKDLDLVEEHRLKREKRQLSQAVRELAEEKDRDNRLASLLEQFIHKPIEKPEWLEYQPMGKHSAIASAMLSDTHFDEVVNPEEINGVNAYNRQIAQMRLETFFRNVIRLDRDYMKGVNTQGLILALGGDLVSGNIHEELAQSNDAHQMDTALYWSAQLAAGIELLSKHFDKIHIPVVTGNHGRATRKPRHKARAQDNWDYLIANIVARELSHLGDRVTFDIPLGSEARWPVYGFNYHMTHGDQFRGGNGIAGVLSPIMRGDHNKRKREQAVKSPYDYLVMGHFHQLQRWAGILVNGSLKGYDEYAAAGNFGFEQPQQAFWLTDPDNGMTVFAPVRVMTKDERKLWTPQHKTGASWLTECA
ncbi:hypothetical protein [Endozoicomonas sp. GU-1]|uniref:hypothetical protein n=1 Tax=Endozoicomonas sp. GU-1 TaxID=3009078 RepID=UPI0022B4C28E|nr:hypothetical protein [Endozoicomonas sp. GU-1]WBA79571.1 hypothetical protein O2T12_14400 [Endozoicomonas sp. GU-1]